MFPAVVKTFIVETREHGDYSNLQIRAVVQNGVGVVVAAQTCICVCMCSQDFSFSTNMDRRSSVRVKQLSCADAPVIIVRRLSGVRLPRDEESLTSRWAECGDVMLG